MLEMRAGWQKESFIYLFMSYVNSGTCRQILVKIISASRTASRVRRTEVFNTLRRVDNATKHDSNFGSVFPHVTIFYNDLCCHTTQTQRTVVNLPTLRFLYKAVAS